MFDSNEGKGRKKAKGGAKGRVTVYIKKGSEYVTVHSSECLLFLKQWSEKLSKITLVRELGLNCLMNKALKQSAVNFPPGHLLVREGDKASYVYAIMEVRVFEERALRIPPL